MSDLGFSQRGSYYELCREKTCFQGFRPDPTHTVQPQEMARGLKFFIWEVEGLQFHCSENIGADQLCSYCAADQQLCFCIYAKSMFSREVAHIMFESR